MKLSDTGQLRYHKVDTNGMWVDCHYAFSPFSKWSIYEEPKWYDNIPECGVLCKTIHGTFALIKGRCSNGTYIGYNGNIWINVEPLTKEEVMQYIWKGEDEKID
jgi:hypothetical protein